MLYFTIMGFVLDQVQPGHKESSSWVDGPGWREWRPRTERLLRVVSAGAGLTIATSMTNSHSTDTSRSLWKQNKLNNKGESWHSQPFSQSHQINCPSQIRARGRRWSPRLVTNHFLWQVSVLGHDYCGDLEMAGKVPSSADLTWSIRPACIPINNIQAKPWKNRP